MTWCLGQMREQPLTRRESTYRQRYGVAARHNEALSSSSPAYRNESLWKKGLGLVMRIRNECSVSLQKSLLASESKCKTLFTQRRERIRHTCQVELPRTRGAQITTHRDAHRK